MREPARRIRNIVLTGFMGVGKSTIGRLLAQKMEFEIIDTDHRIENEQHRTISEIFESEGESAFRALERDFVTRLGNVTKAVISAGGGLVLDSDNVTSLKKHALIVCLWATPESIYNRVKTQKHRPLLNCDNPEAAIRELLAKREPIYRATSDVLISTELRSANEVVSHVERQFRIARRQSG